MTFQIRLTAFAFGVASASFLAAMAPGCGGDATPPAKYATSDAGGAPVTNGAAQTGVTEGPQEHAEMTGSAKDAYDRGWKAWLAGDLSGAKAAFTEATQKDTKASAPHYSLGTVLERLGDHSGAQQEFRAAFSVKPDNELAMGAYALSLAHAGHAGEADTFLTDKHAKLPTSARITTFLAEVKSLAKDSATAQQLAQDALRLDPDFKDAMVTIARDHYRARRMDLAKYALQAILDGFGDSSPARDKENAEAHLLRGLIEREQNQRLAAMADFEAARTKRPDLVEAVIQVGAMKLEAGNVAEATPLLESATRFAPNSPLAHLNLGDAYRLGGRPQDAKREFDTALSQDSSLAVVHYDLGLLYLFSPSIPGTNADSQVATAIKELETFKSMRGAKAAPGTADDTDELLTKARTKQNEMKLAASAPPAAASPPAKSSDAGAASKK
jgi:Tfp pilus assembly protein PilF